MACCYPIKDRRERALNQEIERLLKKDKRETAREIKILLLGAGESGKSTFMKQMQIIHGEGFTRTQREVARDIIFENIFDCLSVLQQQLLLRGLSAAVDIEEVLAAGSDLKQAHVSLITAFWEDPTVQDLFAKRGQFNMMDSPLYFIPNLPRILGKDYSPSDQDVLYARKATTGVHEYRILIDAVPFRFVDVGGQRSERKNWIHCFTSVTSIIFIVACSEYDQWLTETKTNRMVESIGLFSALLGHGVLNEKSIILFLNKIDLIEGKLATSNLADFFPNYKGGRYDKEAALDFIMNMFLEPSKNLTQAVYYHKTCATDTKVVKVIFDSVRITLINDRLKSYYLI